jgi:L-alanine-DL-glutamate epimerase-like enolase superfamily enzyme
MKITAVRTHILEAALSQPFAYSRAWYDTRTVQPIEHVKGIVRVPDGPGIEVDREALARFAVS